MYKRNSVWWCCIRHKGRKIQKSLKIPAGKKRDELLARDIESKIRVQLVEEEFFVKPIGSKKTFRDLMQKFMKEYSHKKAKNTQRSYSTCLKHLDAFFGDMQLNTISPKMISTYKAKRHEEGVKAASINRERAVLSKAISLAVNEWEWLSVNPVSRVPKEVENNDKDRWLTDEIGWRR